jgi:hypothetical protein
VAAVLPFLDFMVLYHAHVQEEVEDLEGVVVEVQDNHPLYPHIWIAIVHILSMEEP